MATLILCSIRTNKSMKGGRHAHKQTCSCNRRRYTATTSFRGTPLAPNTTRHLDIAHPMRLFDSGDASEILVIEYRRRPGIFNSQNPDLSFVKKNFTNCGIVQSSHGRKLAVITELQMLQVHERPPGFRTL